MADVHRFAGAGVAGALELTVCLINRNTVAKRLMNSQKAANSATNIRDILFQDSAKMGTAQKVRSLFPGIGFGAVYKISQRVYKFGGQPYVKDAVQGVFAGMSSSSSTGDFGNTFNKNGQIRHSTNDAASSTNNSAPLSLEQKKANLSKSTKILSDGIAGAMMGAGEVVLLPLDALKIKAQTNAEFRNNATNLSALNTLIKNEGGILKLYAGWEWTLMRNIPGSFALFGMNGFVKEYVFGLKNHYKDATFFQNTVSSLAGSMASILVACPCDVIKTRIQSGVYANKRGIDIAASIGANEGIGGFFKGAVPKVL